MRHVLGLSKAATEWIPPYSLPVCHRPFTPGNSQLKEEGKPHSKPWTLPEGQFLVQEGLYLVPSFCQIKPKGDPQV